MTVIWYGVVLVLGTMTAALVHDKIGGSAAWWMFGIGYAAGLIAGRWKP